MTPYCRFECSQYVVQTLFSLCVDEHHHVAPSDEPALSSVLRLAASYISTHFHCATQSYPSFLGSKLPFKCKKVKHGHKNSFDWNVRLSVIGWIFLVWTKHRIMLYPSSSMGFSPSYVKFSMNLDEEKWFYSFFFWTMLFWHLSSEICLPSGVKK